MTTPVLAVRLRKGEWMPFVPPARRAAAHVDLAGSVPVVVVDAPDWLDVATAPAVESVLRQVLSRAPSRLAVDLSATAMADPYGLGMLARVHADARRQGTEMWLVGVNCRVRRVLALLGLEGTLRVQPSEAVQAR